MRNMLLSAFISFGLAGAVSAFAAGQPAGPSCETELAKNGAIVRRPLTVTGLRILETPGDGWMGWQLTHDGRALLAVISDGGKNLPVFEPVAGVDPVFSGKPGKQGGQLSRAVWLNANELASGDNNGNLLRFTLGGKSAGEKESFGANVQVLPELNLQNELGTWQGDLALGLGQLSRVRIMPVGSVGPVRDLQAQAAVRDVLLHRTMNGRRLAAVVTTQSLEVFDLDTDSSRPIYSQTLSPAAKPQWIVDDLGKSALMFQQNGILSVVYPLGDHADVKLPVPEEAAVQAMSTVGGEVMVLISGPDQSAQIYSYSHDAFHARGFVDGRSPMQAFLESPTGAIFLAYMKKPKESGSRLQISRLSDLSNPVYTLNFEEEETVQGFAMLSLDPYRHLLAVGTSKRIHILELTQPAPPPPGQ